MSELSLDRVSKRFGDAAVIHDVSLSVSHGEFVVFVGPSGCGKSTLLRMIAGLETISDGTLSIDGQPMNDVPAARRGIAMVFQSYALYPTMTVRQNITFGMECRGVDKAKQAEGLARVARLLQIEPLLNRRPGQLSGGQRQRVAMGRALVRDPVLFLFDEPLSNLDAKLRVEMRMEIKMLHARIGSTIVYVTHDQIEAMTMATRIGVIEHGRLVQVGTPQQIYEDPVSSYVAARLGTPRINLLPCAAIGTLHGPMRAATVGVRAEHLRLHAPASAGTHRAAHVTRIERLSDLHLVHVQLDGSEQSLITAAPAGARYLTGEAVAVEVLRPLWFDADGQRIAA